MDESVQEIPVTASALTDARCPIDHTAWSRQKTATISDPTAADEISRPPIERAADGTWHVYGFQEARAILRSDSTKQAGFGAKEVERSFNFVNPPILFLEGPEHHRQRRQTARFFVPKTVNANYRELMEKLSDELIADLKRTGQANLSKFAFKLSLSVVARIVGLTSSRDPLMYKRLDTFFSQTAPEEGLPFWHPRRLRYFFFLIQSQMSFYLKDVKPAILARRREPQDDLISHMVAQGALKRNIYTECLTYASAGMVTTREFMNIAAWHLLEQPELRTRYLVAPEAERYLILEEILRIEPVIGHLYRRATEDMTVESEGTLVTIPQGALIHLHSYAINSDPRILTEHTRAICPGREVLAERVPASLMGFGDGDHRCAGLYVAMQETDIFLQKLLALDTLRIMQPPTLTWNETSTGYEIRNFMISVA